MSFKVIIEPSRHAYTVEPGETLLDAALREGFELPYGCRNGACGACKGKVLQGKVDQGNYAKHALSDAEIAEGMTLFCCAKAETDLVIESREIKGTRDLKIKSMPARVQTLQKLAPDVMLLELKLPASERMQFLAGQYIDILLKDGKRRSFSLANAPHDDAMLQLHVRRIEGGTFTDHVFDRMQPKDILRIEGPLGSFFLREDSEKPIIFLASGTGFAPVKSIVEHALGLGMKRKMILYWGAYTLSDLYLRELAEKWASEHENFSFVPVLSAPRLEDNWHGRTGFVHQAVLDDFESLAAYQVYACGAPAMVQAAHRDFTETRGLPPEEFLSDAFTFSADSKKPS